MEAHDSNPISLFAPYKMGSFNLSHRVVLPPLTRNRSYKNVPQPHAIEYYSQRTTEGGLIISESNGACDISKGCPNMPGIWKKEQVEAWKPIVQAVHDKGGIFFAQIWHTGRIPDYSHAQFLFGWTFDRVAGEKNALSSIDSGSTPHQLTTDDINCIVEDFRVAARNAIEAGFDGVEIHAANGYLIERFMNEQMNDRKDEYGGSLENRCRLVLQVVEAVANEIGADKVGIKLSPFNDSNGVGDSDPETLGIYMANELSKIGILYVHMVEKRVVKSADNNNNNNNNNNNGNEANTAPRSLGAIRKAFKGTFIVCGGYGKTDGEKTIADNYADLVSFGRMFLANPDLPKRFELDASLNKHERNTFYTPDPVVGYTDYPFLQVAS